jgi:hypothetical protein
MYWDPSEAVTGNWPAKSEKRASSRNFDDGWMVARSLMDGCSTSWYSERNSHRKSSSEGSAGGGDDAAAEWYAERVSFAGQDLKISSARDLGRFGGSCARASRLYVAEGVGWYVWFVAADHLRGEVRVVTSM